MMLLGFKKLYHRVIKAAGIVISQASPFHSLEAEIPSILGLPLADEAGVQLFNYHLRDLYHLGI